MLAKFAACCVLAMGCFAFSNFQPIDNLTPDNTMDDRQKAAELVKQNNFRDALEIYGRLLNSADETDPNLVSDFQQIGVCYAQLQRTGELDGLREKLLQLHSEKWQLHLEIAKSYLSGEHFGFITAGEFTRGQARGSGELHSSEERDRVRALQILLAIRDTADANGSPSELAEFYSWIARSVEQGRSHNNAWKLQATTDLEVLPDYDPTGWNHMYGHRRGGAGDGWGGASKGAPVDEEGNPVFYHIPESWEAAKNDGERVRWAYEKSATLDAARFRDQVDLQFARFLQQQFGVQTMAQYGSLFRDSGDDDAAKPKADSPFAVSTLTDDETICRLATGVKRIKLPDEFNHIRWFQKLADRESSSTAFEALTSLGTVYENRQQYPVAVGYLTKASNLQPDNQSLKERIAQIVKPWGMFETVGTQPAGKGASAEFRFRNGNKVSFKANRIDVDGLLNELKAHLKSSPRDVNWQHLQVGSLAHSIFQDHMAKFVKEEIATWDLELDPRPDHFDRRITVTTPLQKAGAYLVTAQMADGNTSSIVMWVADTTIVRKQIDNGWLYLVADAVTGKPVANANVEFFGWKTNWVQNQNRHFVEFKNFAERSDKDGFVQPPSKLLEQDCQWFAVARTNEGRHAFLGMDHVWYNGYASQSYQETKVYGISDRPIYRPGQTVKYKFWIRTVGYEPDKRQEFAGQRVRVRIHNPQGAEIQQFVKELDQDGALSTELELPADAMLGQYGIQVNDESQRRFGYSVLNFRVEEYKKPEYEVKVIAPDKPTQLGDNVPVKIKAEYYFGGPVTDAVVKYKVNRTKKDQRWFPVGRWDWLYGNGYLWLSSDYDWYPGFGRWGCLGPRPFWWNYSPDPPELVLDEEGKLNEDGTLEFFIDTAIAKAIHGDQDHEYSITAEVVDSSRRTIVGSGNVIVSHKPFSVYVWASRGYARSGEPIEVTGQARTADGKGVAGKGKLTLYRIVYDAQGKPTETELQHWDVEANEQGEVRQPIKATESGQFRLALTLTDDKDQTVEGGQLLHVVGDRFDSANFRYNDLEVLLEKPVYNPGERAKLLINTNKAGARILVWARPSSSNYHGRPQIIDLDGKSTTVELDVLQSDMPNFYVEVLTIFDAKVHVVTKEILVPPVSKVVDVEIIPEATKVLPGQESTVTVKLTQPDGQPFTGGSLVMTMYDRALEYISGGSNVSDIREHFWKFKRHHYPQTTHSLDRSGGNLVKHHSQQMAFLGVFGRLSADVSREGMELQKGMGRGRAVRSAAPGGGAPEMAMMMADAEGMPAPSADLNLRFESRSEAGESGRFDMSGQDGGLAEPVVRTTFADAAYWSVDLKPNAEGIATATIKMPENLTAWKIRTWAMGSDTSVGEGTSEVVTAKNIMVRLQAPRFFVEKDEVILSAIVHNYFDVSKRAEVSIDFDSELLTSGDSATQTVDLPPGGHKRVDWKAKVIREGEIAITVAAKTDVESDAMQVKYPVLVHGILKTESFTGIIRKGQESVKYQVRVPEERRPELSRLEVRYSPSLAGAMIDALPYLNDYPYGCTEQTLNRFLPTVVTLDVLKRMNLDLNTIKEKRTNLNAQEIGDAQERTRRWAIHNPVFDEAEVLAMAKKGVADLTAMQNSDGGWGWFSGISERSWPHTTATVVRGLRLAQENGIAIVPDVLQRGVAWLESYEAEQIRLLQQGDRRKDLPPNHPDLQIPYRGSADNLDALIRLALIEAGIEDKGMNHYVYRDRGNLSLYGKGLAGLAFHLHRDIERRDMLIQNIDQFVKYDDENQTAFIDLPNQNYWWYWYGDSIEANAMYLKLMAQVKPNDKITQGLVKYLINNRKNATYWKSTRDTALCVEAFADYIKASGEDSPQMKVDVIIDGTVVKTVEINKENFFTFDNQFIVEGLELSDGEHEVEIRRSGDGTLYTNAYLTNFTKEDDIKAAGLEIQVQRAFYRLDPIEGAEAKVAGQRGQVVDQKVEKYQRVPLKSWDEVKSGDLIEIELEIDSKNDYEYVIFEDMKAAGCEPVDLQSGYRPGGLHAYVEFRDQRVSSFVRVLNRGKHSLSYRMRAEIPGQFSALPTRAWAMYAPELRANSDEMKLKIADREDVGKE